MIHMAFSTELNSMICFPTLKHISFSVVKARDKPNAKSLESEHGNDSELRLTMRWQQKHPLRVKQVFTSTSIPEKIGANSTNFRRFAISHALKIRNPGDGFR